MNANGILQEVEIHAVAGLLKRYLKKLPDPVIPFSQYETFLSVAKQAVSHSSAKQQQNDFKLKQFKKLIDQGALPRANLQTLKIMCLHLNRVIACEKFNKMTFGSIATIFSPTLMRDESGDPNKEVGDLGMKLSVIDFLVRYHESLI
ncbi:unnamed protein product [Ambrosiozyma monospora]|uniref:Unnamed protein product n=1 Tax=Ambrosiozyma monospora TaxID=43982 RepID=A0A9W6Z3L6_AMBMO|nr:unnamed protein product [Ambrosiozyma monospora]